jgi:hypothetical protein
MQYHSIKNRILGALVVGVAAASLSAAEESSVKPVTVGNPAEAAQLSEALQAAYSGGARDITIAPGTYLIPATGRSAIALVKWMGCRLLANLPSSSSLHPPGELVLPRLDLSCTRSTNRNLSLMTMKIDAKV